MIIKNSKSKITPISLIFVLTISVLIIAVPTTSAQETVKTFPFIGGIPNPVGVNQEVLLHTGIAQQLSGPQYGYEGLSITIEKPDGQIDTIDNIRTDATGGTGRIYIPDQIGTYYIQTHFPEQEFPSTLGALEAGTIMEASNSEVLELIVQEEQSAVYQDSPILPEYWSRPIDAQLRNWYTISGNWLEAWPYVPWDMSARTAQYNDGPMTGHIVWAKDLLAMGGLVGGDLGEHGFESGDAYEGKWLPPIIIGGVLYYNQYQAGGGTNVEQVAVAVDLRTGEELWARPLIGPDGNNRRIEFGQTFMFDSYNYHGVFPYLWATAGSTWHAFDPSTGRWVYSMENVPSGFRVRGDNGEIYIYTVNQDEGWMTLWTSAKIVPETGSWIRTREGSVFDASNAYEWNVSIPEGLPNGGGGGVRAVYFEDRILLSDDERWSQLKTDYLHLACINVAPGHVGELYFNTTWSPPSPPLSAVVKLADVEDGVFILGIKETRQVVGMDFDTGEQIWIGDPMQYLEIYSATNDRRSVAQVYDGKLLVGGMSGIIYCHDAKTGAVLWTYEATDPNNEILWGNNWPVYGSFVSDGKLYVHTCEHSPLDPKPRGNPFICIDIESGNELWSINLRGHHWGGYPVIGDSTIAMYNTYDQRIYAMNKGPSETTVIVKDSVINKGDSVLIEGTVMDISPGTEDVALTLRFPKGIPAVADADMSAWMEYVYLQHERPENVRGVEVTLDAVDSDGHYTTIGTVTTDSSGMFKKMWKPETEDAYTIIATFSGSKAYYASYDQTAIGVGAVSSGTPIEHETSLISTEVAIIAAVAVAAVIGVASYWFLKRK
ncbi:MAG: PQQ-binding-like beta-propeller repeat protein [Candidatus Bathyarchaeota archaeon]